MIFHIHLSQCGFGKAANKWKKKEFGAVVFRQSNEVYLCQVNAYLTVRILDPDYIQHSVPGYLRLRDWIW